MKKCECYIWSDNFMNSIFFPIEIEKKEDVTYNAGSRSMNGDAEHSVKLITVYVLAAFSFMTCKSSLGSILKKL